MTVTLKLDSSGTTRPGQGSVDTSGQTQGPAPANTINPPTAAGNDPIPPQLYQGTVFPYPTPKFSKPELYEAMAMLNLGDALVLLQAVMGDLMDALQSVTMGRLDADQALSRQRLRENIEKLEEATRKMQEASRKSKISSIINAVCKCLVCLVAVVALIVAVSSCVATGGATLGVAFAILLAVMSAFGAAWSAASDVSKATGGKGYDLANRINDGSNAGKAGSKFLAGLAAADWGTMAGAIAQACKADDKTIAGVTVAFTVIGMLAQAKCTQAATLQHLQGVRRAALMAGDMEYVRFVDKFKVVLSSEFLFKVAHSFITGILTAANGIVDMSVAKTKLEQALAEGDAKELEAAIEAIKLAIQNLMEHMQSNAKFIEQVNQIIMEILNALMKNMQSLAAGQNHPA